MLSPKDAKPPTAATCCPFQDYIGGVEPRSVIVQGDMVYCPKCKGNFPIDECDSTRTWNDKGMVFHGHRAACGAMIISDHPPQNPALAEALLNAAQQDEELYNEQPQLVALPIEGVPYYIETMDGRTFHGHIGADGLLPRIDTLNEDEYSVYWGDEALAKMDGNEA